MLNQPGARVSFVSPQHLALAIARRPSAVFLDVDGTLLPIQARPTDVRSDPALRTLLTFLAGQCDGALALVSGRTIADLDRIFAPLALPAAGMHGGELRASDGTREIVAPDLLEDIRPAARRFVVEHAGLLLEDKGLTLAVHYRQRPELEATVIAALSAFAAGSDLAVQRGKMVAELKPAAIDKGRAIARLMMQRPFSSRRAVFIGDDVTDESGFRFVNSIDGLSVRVGPLHDDSAAQMRVPDVDGVHAALNAISADAHTMSGTASSSRQV